MNRAKFDQQWQAFLRLSRVDGRYQPNPGHHEVILNEDTPTTGFDFGYTMHCGWATRRLVESNPESHADFGSYVYYASVASAFVRNFTFYDIRPANIPLPGLSCGAADLTHLHFEDNSLPSMSCLHVLEHIGLGRYGDALDAAGDIKAAKELVRVLKPGGQLLYVAPLHAQPHVCFNAHRFYNYTMVRKLFTGLELKEFTLIGNGGRQEMEEHAPVDRLVSGNGVNGCFWFVKP